MLSAWWLAMAGLTLYHQPLPEAPLQPSVLAVASGRVPLQMPCYGLVCSDAEWRPPDRYTRLLPAPAPGVLQPLRPQRASPLASRRRAPLHSPASRRHWSASHASHSRVDTRYGYEAIRTPDTRLRVEFGTGYRLRPYADYGTAVPGPIARGTLQFTHHLADRARLQQHVLVETGRENTTLRQVLAVDVVLQPQWTLQSTLELRHDTGADAGRGATSTQGALRLRYSY